MKLIMLASLKEQAECLLMTGKGRYEFSPIEFCKEQITNAYKLNDRNPPKDIYGERLMIAMLTWLAAYEWWLILGPKDNPDPSDYGIFSISGANNHKQLKVYCHDYTHFKSLPVLVDYRGMNFGRVLWDAASQRATYRNDVPAAKGIC
jgi:hypothetical protein